MAKKKRKQKNKIKCAEEISHYYDLSPEDRIYYRYCFDDKEKLIEFKLQYTAIINGKRKPITRYDNFPHFRGKKYKGRRKSAHQHTVYLGKDIPFELESYEQKDYKEFVQGIYKQLRREYKNFKQSYKDNNLKNERKSHKRKL